MQKDLDIYGIGNAIMDFLLHVEEGDLKRFALEKGGMKLCEVTEQKAILHGLTKSTLRGVSGGSAANSMIAAAQLGSRVGYGCLVGNDDFGRAYAEEMKELGVALHTQAVDGETTGTSVILITPDAERTMNTHLGASALFDAPHVSEEMIMRAQWLYIEGYLLSSETGQRAAHRAVELAQRHDTKVVVTFSDKFIIDIFGDALRHVVLHSDLVFANFTESRAYTGLNDEEEVWQAMKKISPNVVMTMSERGARVYYNGSEERVSAFPVTAVDDTGAGDMFAGAFLHGISHKMSAHDVTRLACFLSSRVVSQLGARIFGDLRTLGAELSVAGEELRGVNQ